MKKLSTSVSPFLMLIIPVILFVGLSLLLKAEEPKEEFTDVHNVIEIKPVEKVSVTALMNIITKK